MKSKLFLLAFLGVCIIGIATYFYFKNLNKKTYQFVDTCEETFLEYPSGSDYATQIIWLKKTFKKDTDMPLEICGCVKAAHNIGACDFMDMIKKQWGDNQVEYTEISIESIHKLYAEKKYNINYEHYIMLKGIGNKIVPSIVDDYQQVETCYSIPLFESIYQEDPKTTLQFTNAKIDDKNTSIVFAIKGSKDGFFDYSQVPTLAGPLKLPL